MVEVKGTTSDGTTVLLTPNEVDHARNHPDEAALFVCSNIDVVLTQRGRLATQGGRVLLLHLGNPTLPCSPPWAILFLLAKYREPHDSQN